MFEDATFHSRSLQPTQTRQWMLLTLAINLVALAALILVPLIHPGSLPSTTLANILYAPAPPPALAPVTHTTTQSLPRSPQLLLVHDPFAPPTRIPKAKPDLDPPPGSESMTDLNPLGAGGQSALGVTTPAANLFHPAPPIVVKTAIPRKHAISEGVATGLLLTKTAPAYPIIAKTAGVSGTVILAATISKSGTIENLRVLSGPPMLRQSAIEAVQTWRYRPYLLNNQPVEVETTVNIVFSMANH